MHMRIRIAIFCGCLLFWSNYHRVLSQDKLPVIMSSNPAYTRDQVMLTCPNWNTLTSMLIMDAFNGTQLKGTWKCDRSTSNVTIDGIFARSNTAGCRMDKAENVTITLIAELSLELEYNCTIFNPSGMVMRSVQSILTLLKIYVLPEPPSLHPSVMAFNESDAVTIRCDSRYGKPPSTVHLTITKRSREIHQQVGIDSVSFILFSPLSDWHEGSVTCRVENHHFPNATDREAKSMVSVNYITAIRDVHPTVNTFSSGQILDCSADVVSFPGVSYNWSLSAVEKIPELVAGNSGAITLLQGQSGYFYCAATNNVTLKTVRVTYEVINKAPYEYIAIPAGLVVIMIVVLVLYKLGYLRKLCHCSVCRRSRALQQPSDAKEAAKEGENIEMMENQIYSTVSKIPANETERCFLKS